MSENNIYDPEDLEKLLRTKTFSELLPEEKAFALQYVENDREYDSIRETFQLFGTLPELDAVIEPLPETKARLMREFEDDKAAVLILTPWEKFKNWIWDTNKALFYRPAFQLASLLFIVSAGVYLFNFNSSEQLAETTSSEDKIKTEVEKESKNEFEEENTSTTSTKQGNAKLNNENQVDKSPIEKENVALKKTEELEEIPLDAKDTDLDLEFDISEPEENSVIAENESIDFSTEEISDDSYTLDSDLQPTFTISDNSTFLTEESVKFENGEDVFLDKNLEDTEELDEVLVNYDARTDAGNSAGFVEAKEITIAAENYSAESTSVPSSQFGLVTGDSEIQAYSAATFSNLLSKLHTAQ